MFRPRKFKKEREHQDSGSPESRLDGVWPDKRITARNGRAERATRKMDNGRGNEGRIKKCLKEINYTFSNGQRTIV